MWVGYCQKIKNPPNSTQPIPQNNDLTFSFINNKQLHDALWGYCKIVVDIYAWKNWVIISIKILFTNSWSSFPSNLSQFGRHLCLLKVLFALGLCPRSLPRKKGLFAFLIVMMPSAGTYQELGFKDSRDHPESEIFHLSIWYCVQTSCERSRYFIDGMTHLMFLSVYFSVYSFGDLLF